jgi:cytidylate kinase
MRIFQREGGSVEQRLKETQLRDKNDTKRFKRLYNIDNNNTSVADLVIESDDLSVEEVANIIVKEIKKRLE